MKNAYPMKYLVLGASGQLGKAVCELLTDKQKNFLPLSRTKLDITQFAQVKDALERIKPSVIINCSAYNFVDLAEEESELAHLVNEHATRHLATLCASHRIKFLHFSSDYVFSGKAKVPYQEDSQTSPINTYGLSKLLGEKAIIENSSNYIIFRSSWIYGNGTQNFIYKLLQWTKQKETLSVAFDEVSIPNWTRTLAEITLKAIDDDLRGLFHLTGGGFCSRYELACKIIDHMKLNKKIIPVEKKTFDLKAKRGDFLALANDKLGRMYSIPHWTEDLEKFLTKKPFA